MHRELTPRAVGLAGSLVAGLQGLPFRVSSMASIQSLLIWPLTRICRPSRPASAG
jgi:hypothetical protein